MREARFDSSACVRVSKWMRLMVGALAVVAMLSGCSKRNAGIGIGAGLVIAAAGGVVASNPGGNQREAMGDAYMGAGIAVFGGAVLLTSVIGLIAGLPSGSSGPKADPQVPRPLLDADETK